MPITPFPSEPTPNSHHHLTNLTSEGVPTWGGAWPESSWESRNSPTIPDLFRILRRHARFIGAISCTALLVGLLYIAVATKRYTSTATLKFTGYTPPISTTGTSDITEPQREESVDKSYPKTLQLTLQGLTVAERVLSDAVVGPKLLAHLEPNIEHSTQPPPGAIPGYTHSASTLRRYLTQVSATQVRDSSLLNLSVTTPDPELSREVAATHAAKFIEVVNEERRRRFLDSLNLLDMQSAELQAKMAKAERTATEYAKQYGLLASQTDTSEESLLKRLGALLDSHSRATAERINVSSLFQMATSAQGRDSSVLDDPAILSLRTRLEEQQAEYARSLAQYTPDYPPLREQAATIASLQKLIQQQRSQALAALEVKYKSALAAELDLSIQVNEEWERVNQQAIHSAEFKVLKRESDSLNELYQNLLRDMQKLQLSAAASGSNVIISEMPTLPDRAASPRKGLVLFISLLIGLFSSISWILFREMHQMTVRTATDIEDFFRLPALGSIPLGATATISLRQPSPVRKKSRLRRRIFVAIRNWLFPWRAPLKYTAPRSEDELLPALTKLDANLAESFRALRATLLVSPNSRNARRILCASALPGEGKTTVSTNLALAFAQAGFRVLMVDADRVAGAATLRFGLAPIEKGYTDLLAGNASFDSVVHKTVIPNLAVTPRGNFDPERVADLIVSPRLQDFLTRAASTFDYIIIDSPPTSATADALLLAQQADAVLLVVRSEITERLSIVEALRQLTAVNAPVLGVVLNGVRPTPLYGYGNSAALYRYRPPPGGGDLRAAA